MTNLRKQVAAPPPVQYTPFASIERRANDGPPPRPVESRFWAKVDKKHNGCWLWTGPSGSIAYFVGDKEVREEAQRISWRIHFGPVPDDYKIKHLCGDSWCVRPSHLCLQPRLIPRLRCAPKPEERFWSRVKKSGNPKGCWLWRGPFNWGYGAFSLNDKSVHAQRVSWEMAFGPIPAGMGVLHKCDVPACVRPSHLFLGDTEANNRDKMEKGRQAKGEKIGASKLTEKKVREIRKLRKNGATYGEIASRYGVTKENIGSICRRRYWKHVQ